MLYINWWEVFIKLFILKLNEWEKVWINEGSKNIWIWKYVSWSFVKFYNVVIMNRFKLSYILYCYVNLGWKYCILYKWF